MITLNNADTEADSAIAKVIVGSDDSCIADTFTRIDTLNMHVGRDINMFVARRPDFIIASP